MVLHRLPFSLKLSTSTSMLLQMLARSSLVGKKSSPRPHFWKCHPNLCIGRCNTAIVYVVPIVKCCLPWPRRGHADATWMAASNTKVAGFQSMRPHTISSTHKRGRGMAHPPTGGGAGSNFCVLASSRPFREGGRGALPARHIWGFFRELF